MRLILRRIFYLAVCLMLLCQAALAYETLEKGDRSSEVQRMQLALSRLGYAVECDGNYGTETVNAVKLFQRDYNLEADGKAGDETLSTLYGLISNETEAAVATYAAVATAESDEVRATVYCADGGKLNLRARASSSGTVLKQIPTGTVLTIYEKGSKWCYTNYKGEWGYVMTSFLVFNAAETTSQPSSTATTGTKATVYCSDGGKLNLRKTASSSAKVLTRIPNGTTLTILDRGSSWCKTTYGGETGYVMTSFLVFKAAETTTPSATVTATPRPSTEATTPPATTYETAKVYCSDGGKLNLRKTASASAKVIGQIPTGTELVIYDRGSTWCKTSYGGQTGYVMTKYLRFTGSSGAPSATTAPTTAPGASTAKTAQVYCSNGGKLNMRSGRGTSYKVVCQIPNLSQVTVLADYGTWTKVSYNGDTGYVKTEYLIFNTSTTTTPPPTTETTTPPPSTETTTPPVYTGAMRYGEYRYATVQTASGGTLNLRKGPGTSYGKVTDIPNGARIVVRAINGEWCDVYYGDKMGYVKTEYLNIDAGKGNYVDTSVNYDTSILTRTLRGGETGADVTLVQTRLVELKYLTSVTGTYDDATKAAVSSFQNLHNLTVDGKAGDNTYYVLFSAEAFPYTTVTGNYKSYNIRYNEGSDLGGSERIAAVRSAQERLRELNYLCQIDGDFEEMTHDAIVDFQLRNGLTANGILDVATQVRLFSSEARDAASPARYYLPDNAGTQVNAPEDIGLMHWANEVKAMIGSGDALTVYDPETGLSFKLKNLSRGRHWDVEPATLEDTLIMRKAFNGMSWDIRVVYVMLPDGSWSMATMHNRAHGTNTIKNNGFGGQNCVHFLRDMSEAQANDPSYGVRNQEALREAWYKLTGETIAYK